MILGIGAMGCLFGARLTSHADVTLVGHWPEQLAALRHGPLRIVSDKGGDQLITLRATGDVNTIGPVDVALIMTKAPKTAAAGEGAARILKDDGLVVTLQNGVGNLEILAGLVGDHRVTLGVTTQGAAMEAPGRLRLGGSGPTVLASRPEIETQVSALAALFARAGMDVQVAGDVTALVWGKLAVNAAINPLTALLRVPNGRLLESDWARQVMKQAAQEVASVAAAQGIILPFDDPAARAEEVARQTAPNRSSMLQDIQRGEYTEIDAICGAVVRAGELAGISTPANQILYNLIRATEELVHLTVQT